MLCADLAQTWTDLRDWLDGAKVMVLPPLTTDRPLVRLDDPAAIDPPHAADPDAPIRRLRALIEHFDIRAVYVGQRSWACVAAAQADPRELTSVTVRAVAAGVVHELRMVASWYDVLTEPALRANGVSTGPIVQL